MCIIIYNKTGILSKKIIQNSSKNNPDGAGLMYAHAGRLYIVRDLVNEKIIARYYELRKAMPTVPIVLHFRIATDGGITTDNCHPYRISANTALVHNGILREYSGLKSSKSDTRLFIDANLKPFSDASLFAAPLLRLIELAIGSGNKFVMMRADGETAILNEKAGVWDKPGENWFSNYTYEPAVVYPRPGAKYYHNDLPHSWLNRTNGHKSKHKYPAALNTARQNCLYCEKPLLTDDECEMGFCYLCAFQEWER